MRRVERQLRMQRYFEHEFGTQAVKILAGELYATDDGTAIATLLGSCVSVCLFDRGTGVGGMNHFMLPEVAEGGKAQHCGGACLSSSCARYGSCAMRRLLQQLDALGARREKLEAKVFGAGRVMAGMSDVGANNAFFALEYLEKEGIPVVASDLGGISPRKVIFFPASGKALVKKLGKLPARM